MMSLLRSVFCVLIAMMLSSTPAGAEQTVYVSEEFEITLRTGPGNDNKILSLVRSGKELQLLERGGDWSRVREPGGKEGWVRTRYLTADPPCNTVLERVAEERDRLEARVGELERRLARLETGKEAVEADLARTRRELSDLRMAYKTLQDESSGFLELKERYQKTAAAMRAERRRSEGLAEENRRLKHDRVIQWVLTGGGIMLAGFFTGLFSAGRRRPRSSLY